MSRISSDLYAGEVTGSTYNDRLELTARYGITKTVTGLLVSSGSFEWNADDPVQGSASLTVVDPDGRLQPYGPTHPLNCYGSMLQATAVSGASGTQIPLGSWRIRNSEPHGQYQVEARGDDWDVTYTGGNVELKAGDPLAAAMLQKLDGESPQEQTYLGEVERLLRNIVAVQIHPDVVDQQLPAGLTYNDSRINTVQDHVTRVGAAYRIGPGVLKIVPRRGSGEPLKLGLGNRGSVTEVSHKFSDRDAANIFVAEGRGEDGQPIVSRAPILGGPMAPDSPFGPVPRFKRSTATTQLDVDADAIATRDEYLAAGEGVVEAVVLTNLAVELQDRVELPLLTVAGAIPVVGRAVRMKVTIADGLFSKSMRLSAAVPLEKLEEVQYRIDRHHG